MPEEQLEYRKRRHSQPKKTVKDAGYLKKFIRQAAFSALILLFVFASGILGEEFSAKLRNTVKTAVNYRIDTEQITNTIRDIFEKTTKSGEIKNEDTAEGN